MVEGLPRHKARRSVRRGGAGRRCQLRGYQPQCSLDVGRTSGERGRGQSRSPQGGNKSSSTPRNHSLMMVGMEDDTPSRSRRRWAVRGLLVQFLVQYATGSQHQMSYSQNDTKRDQNATGLRARSTVAYAAEVAHECLERLERCHALVVLVACCVQRRQALSGFTRQ